MAAWRNDLAILFALCLCGCHLERIVIEEPVRNQFVEVKSEDHIEVCLDENAARGYEWTVECDDSLVDMTIDHEPGEQAGQMGLATVHLHVLRGFNGPAVVYLRYARGRSGDSVRTVKLQLYRRQTNVAVWR